MKRSTEVTFTCNPAVAKRLRAASTATDGGASDPVTRILSQPTIRVTPAVMANPSTLAALRNTGTPLTSFAVNASTRNPLASPFALASWNNELNTPKNNMQHCHVIHVEAPHHMTPSAQNALFAAITRTPVPAQQQQQQQQQQQVSAQVQHQPNLTTTTTHQQQVAAAVSVPQKQQQHQTSVTTTIQQPSPAATSNTQQQQQQVPLAISMPQNQQQRYQSLAVATTLQQQQQQLPNVTPMQQTPTSMAIELSPEDFSQLLGKARLQQHRTSIATPTQQQQLPPASSMLKEQPQQQQQHQLPAATSVPEEQSQQQLPTATSMLEKQQQQVAPAGTESSARIKIEKDADANSTPGAVPAASPSTDEGKGDSDAGDATSTSDDVEIVDDRLCSKEFVEFLNSRDFSDVVLITDSGREFHAHKIVLSAKSPVFKNMLKLFGGEVRLRIEVKDVSDIVMEEVLRFIYSGTVTRIKSCAYELYLAAERYVLRELKERCAKAVTVDNVIFTPTNAINLLIVSQQSCNVQLKKKAIEFVNQHAAQIISSIDFRKLVEFYPHLLAELYFHVAVKAN